MYPNVLFVSLSAGKDNVAMYIYQLLLDNVYIFSFAGKRTLGRPRRRWEDNIRMDLEEMGVSAGNWVDSAQDRDYWRDLENAALNIRVP